MINKMLESNLQTGDLFAFIRLTSLSVPLSYDIIKTKMLYTTRFKICARSTQLQFRWFIGYWIGYFSIDAKNDHSV